MEHRRIVPFGICSLLLAAAPAVAAPSGEQAVSYRGTYVCQSFIAGRDILRVPIDLVVRNGNVEFARPLLNRLATQVVGNEIAHGTTDADGKIHLTSTWQNGGIFHAEYSGTLTASGGTLTGTQTWHGARGQNAAGPVQQPSCSSQRPTSRCNNHNPINRRQNRHCPSNRHLSRTIRSAPSDFARGAVRRPTI